MSRVTINDICSDCDKQSFDEYWDIRGIEVVPRKMVEMIIKKCEEIQNDNYHDDEPHECGKCSASDEIKEYAESLLKQFEEDKR